jgi:hypothetical protein
MTHTEPSPTPTQQGTPERARQHGALEFSIAPIDLDTLRRYRLGRLREQMRQQDVAGLLLFDPVNTRYAIDATNMQLWAMHYETRCVSWRSTAQLCCSITTTIRILPRGCR